MPEIVLPACTRIFGAHRITQTQRKVLQCEPARDSQPAVAHVLHAAEVQVVQGLALKILQGVQVQLASLYALVHQPLEQVTRQAINIGGTVALQVPPGHVGSDVDEAGVAIGSRAPEVEAATARYL